MAAAFSGHFGARFMDGRTKGAATYRNALIYLFSGNVDYQYFSIRPERSPAPVEKGFPDCQTRYLIESQS